MFQNVDVPKWIGRPVAQANTTEKGQASENQLEGNGLFTKERADNDCK